MMVFELIAERRIREAMAAGAFDGLSGIGQPLALDDDRHVPEDLRLAYRILKNAHCLPPEAELRREIVRLRDLLEAALDEGDDGSELTGELNQRIMELNLTSSLSLRTEVPQLARGTAMPQRRSEG